jgi:Aspartyl protease
MVIVGEWRICDDGVARPAVQAQVGSASGIKLAEYFLVDTGADRSVLSGDFLNRLGLPSSAPPDDLVFQGIGGSGEFVLVNTVVDSLVGAEHRPESAASSLHSPILQPLT